MGIFFNDPCEGDPDEEVEDCSEDKGWGIEVWGFTEDNGVISGV